MERDLNSATRGWRLKKKKFNNLNLYHGTCMLLSNVQDDSRQKSIHFKQFQSINHTGTLPKIVSKVN